MNFENLLYSLADLLLKGFAIMMLAYAVSLLLRRSSASTQSAIWSFAFVALLLLPFTLLVPAQWSWIPKRQANAHEPAKGARESIVLFVPQSSGEVATAERTLPLVRPDGKVVLVGVWLIGLVALLLRRAVGSFQIWRLAQSSVAPPPRIAQLSQDTALHFRLQRVAVLNLSPSTGVPLTWGTWRPVITLPVESVDWAEDRLLIALRHEYAHIRRHDALTRLTAQLACAIHWINPLVWFAAKKMRLLHEQAADDVVLSSGVDPVAYADELVLTVRRLQTPVEFEPALAMAQPCTLEKRVGAVLDGTKNRKPASRAIFTGSTLMAFALVASALAQIEPTQADKTTAPAGKPMAVPEPSTSSNKWLNLTLVPETGTYEGFLRYGQEGFLPEVSTATDLPTVSALNKVFAPRVAEKAPVITPEEFGKVPVEIDAEETKFENGIAVSKGAVKLTYRALIITADLLHYFPNTRTLLAHGKVEITGQNGLRTSGDGVIIEYNLLTDETTYVGRYQPVINGAGVPDERAAPPVAQ